MRIVTAIHTKHSYKQLNIRTQTRTIKIHRHRFTPRTYGSPDNGARLLASPSLGARAVGGAAVCRHSRRWRRRRRRRRRRPFRPALTQQPAQVEAVDGPGGERGQADCPAGDDRPRRRARQRRPVELQRDEKLGDDQRPDHPRLRAELHAATATSHARQGVVGDAEHLRQRHQIGTATFATKLLFSQVFAQVILN